ncbi:LysR substrate-binding domain-containing protein [Pendulispora albinea]|uniref:LysR substrate-binding domain-containing protein n=1 Tax=Pendulispora albinea TaxID=2741071 RepID=A0ABZ2M4H3_9BACT
MNFDRLRSFVVLAERLHFGAAARLLNLSQPALSNQIRLLEEELGAPLFDRGRHGAALTEVGKIFLEEARGLILHADRVLEIGRRAGRGETGRLSIGFGFSTLTLVPRLLAKFRKRRPEVRIDLREMATHSQLDALREGRIHVGFVRVPAGKEFRQLLVLEDRLMLVVPKSQRKEQRRIDLGDFRGSPFILPQRSLSVSYHDHILRMCSHHGFHPRVIQESHESSTIPALVAAGLGVALVAESQLRTRIEGIVVHALDDEMARWKVGAAWRKSEGSPLTSEFLDILRDELASLGRDPRAKQGAAATYR